MREWTRHGVVSQTGLVTLYYRGLTPEDPKSPLNQSVGREDTKSPLTQLVGQEVPKSPLPQPVGQENLGRISGESLVSIPPSLTPLPHEPRCFADGKNNCAFSGPTSWKCHPSSLQNLVDDLKGRKGLFDNCSNNGDWGGRASEELRISKYPRQWAIHLRVR